MFGYWDWTSHHTGSFPEAAESREYSLDGGARTGCFSSQHCSLHARVSKSGASHFCPPSAAGVST